MARTPLFRHLNHLLRVSVAQQRLGLSDSMVGELLEAGRHGSAAVAAYLQQSFSRRRFCQVATGLGAALVLPACRNKDAGAAVSEAVIPPAAKSKGAPRVVVVGGGTAGLTTAYRLHQRGIASSLYEAGNRLGGRMYTEDKFNTEGMFCERGAELVDTGHEELISLSQELGLEIEELYTDAAGLVKDLYHMNGKVYGDRDVIAAFKPVATTVIRDLKLCFGDAEAEVPTYNSALAKSSAVLRLDRMTLTEYLQSMGLSPWLLQVLTISYVGEYGLDTDEQSALNFALLIGTSTDDGFKVFGESDESKRIKGGSERLPRALAKALQGHVPIQMEHELVAVREQGQALQLVFNQGGKTVEVLADQVVLAVPITILRDVDFGTLDLTPVKTKAIKEWGFGTNTKLMLGFKNRTWRTGPHRSGGGLLTDRGSQAFWETTHAQPGKAGIITNFLGGKAGRELAKGLQLKALTDFSRVFTGAADLFDGNKVLQHWAAEPLAKGSYTCSKPGQYTTIYGAPGEPELGGRLVFAGEHCSIDYSGFMNGAVNSGNLAAQFVVTRMGGSVEVPAAKAAGG